MRREERLKVLERSFQDVLAGSMDNGYEARGRWLGWLVSHGTLTIKRRVAATNLSVRVVLFKVEFKADGIPGFVYCGESQTLSVAMSDVARQYIKKVRALVKAEGKEVPGAEGGSHGG